MKKRILARSERSGKRRGESNAYRKADCSFESAVRAAQGFAIKMLISAVLLLSVVASASAQFNLVATIPGHAQSAIVGDVDNDGNNELLVLNSSQKQVRIYDGSLDLKAVLNFSEAPRSAVIADPDDDNKNELIVGTSDGSAGGYVYVGEVHEDKFMQEWKSPWIGSFRWSTELAVGDSDNDGKKEIAVGVSWYGRYLVVYEWTGSTYTQVFRDNIGSDVNSVAYGDIDGDGVEELLVGTACWSDYSARIYDNFSLVYKKSRGATHVSAGDVDEDGIEEMIVGSGCKCGGSTTPIPVVQIVEWNGSAYNISWTSEPFPLPQPEGRVFVDAGQLLKGSAEEIVAGTHYLNPATLRVYSKAAKSYECIWEENITDEDINAVEIGDYNNDGKNEIIIATTKKVRIYEVIGGLANSAWPMFRHDEKHTGRSPYVIPDKPILKWAFNISSPISSSPAIGPDGTIYTGADDGKLYAIGGKELEGKLHITITTDKTEYTIGDIMLANITIANPTGEVKHVLFNWWVTVPSKGFYTAPLATVPMTLPPSYNTTFTYPITVGYWGADSFGAVFCVALTNQTTNKIISFDATFWNYNPATRKKKVSVESIVKEIRRAIR